MYATHDDEGKPVHPAFLPTPQFLSWLDTLQPTPRYAKVLAERAKADHERRDREQAERERLWAAQREERAATEAEEHPVKRQRESYIKKAKHVVLGRLHLMEDDDREHERTRYVEANRFVRG